MFTHHVLAALAVLLFGLTAVVLALNGQDTYAVISVSVLALTVSTLGLLAGPDWSRIEADVSRMRELAEKSTPGTSPGKHQARDLRRALAVAGVVALLVALFARRTQ